MPQSKQQSTTETEAIKLTNRRKKKLAPIGKLIRKRLIELDMTKKDFANAIGANYSYVTYILYGERSGAKYMDKIADVLKLDADKLKKTA
jgi:transcriptional regulator with XRE-family HTH domain